MKHFTKELLRKTRRIRAFALLLIAMVSYSTNCHANISPEDPINGFYYILNEDTKEATIWKSSKENTSPKVTIPKQVAYDNITYQVTTIFEGAFKGMDKMEEIDIPNTIKTIGSYNTFHGCISLEIITIHSETPPELDGPLLVTSEDYVTKDVMLFVPSNAIETYKNSLYGLELRNHFFPIGSTFYKSEEGIQYFLTEDKALVYKGIDIEHCSIPSTTTADGKTYTVTGLYEKSFENCTKLTSIELPSTTQSIGSKTFQGCSNLKKIICNATDLSMDYLFSDFGPTEEFETDSRTYTIDKHYVFNVPVEALDHYKFSGSTKIILCPIGDEREIIDIDGYSYLVNPSTGNATLLFVRQGSEEDIPTSILWKEKTYNVTKVGTQFTLDPRCESIKLPTSLREIEDYAFANNSSIKSLTIPEGVTEIGANAFDGIRSLETLELPSTLVKIRMNFIDSNNSALQTVTCYATTPPVYPDGWELRCGDGTILNVPEGSEDAYKVAAGWKEFYSIKGIPTGITPITNAAFKPQVTINGNNIEISGLASKENVSLYDAEGKLTTNTLAENGIATLAKPSVSGLYIIKTQKSVIKLTIK